MISLETVVARMMELETKYYELQAKYQQLIHEYEKLKEKREWIELTDEKCVEAIDENFEFGLDNGNVSNTSVIRYARAIEAKLKEKNT